MTNARDDYEKLQQTPANSNEIPEQIRLRYRMVFTNPDGAEILADMLKHLGLFGILRSEHDVARHNYAVELLGCLGVLQPDMLGQLPQNDMLRITNALMMTAETSNPKRSN